MRLAVAQVDCTPGDVEANRERCLHAIDEARARGAELVVLPELALTGMQVERFSTTAAVTADAAILAPFYARSRAISIALGFLEDAGAGRIHNAVGYFEDGRLLHVHRKLYLTSYGMLPLERDVLAAGDRVCCFETRFGRAAIAICDDAWHVSVPYLAAVDGAELLLTCAGSPAGNVTAGRSSEELWTAVNRAHALTLQVFDVFANRAGREGALAFWGGSHVIAPDGRMLVRIAHDRPAVAVVDVDLREVARRRSEVPYMREERVDLTLSELRRVSGQ